MIREGAEKLATVGAGMMQQDRKHGCSAHVRLVKLLSGML